MKTMLGALALVALAPAAVADVTLIASSRVIADPAKDTAAPGLVAVRDNKIIGVGGPGASAESLGAQPGEKVERIDLGALTVLPGLIDAHVHLSSDPGGGFARAALFDREAAVVVGAKNARLTVEAGFTTVRDLGSPPNVGQAMRDGTARGLIPGPRILISGPALSIIGGHGDPSAGFNQLLGEAIRASEGMTCTGPVNCSERVREASARGVDWIKITATGGVLSQQARGLGQHFSQPEMNAIVETAGQLGLKVAAHAHGSDGVRGATMAGVTSIEHGTFMTEADAKEMKARATYLCPTLMPAKQYMEAAPGTYTDVVQVKIKQRLDALGKNIKLAKQTGVKIAFCTDTGVSPHGRNGEEFAMMAQYGGLSAREALVSSTRTAAELLGLENQIGVLGAGRSADMIAVDGDPLADPNALTKVRFVMAQGRLIKKP
jgi:imidazolonepropionase-like amidohydrolase